MRRVFEDQKPEPTCMMWAGVGGGMGATKAVRVAEASGEGQKGEAVAAASGAARVVDVCMGACGVFPGIVAGVSRGGIRRWAKPARRSRAGMTSDQ